MNKTTLLNNRYQILSTLGRGGFGETFLATDTYLPSQKKCVIKQLKPVIQEPQIPQWIQDRFKQEACILEYLGEQHHQIPRLYAYFTEVGNFYLVQEWIDGITLTEQVAQQGTLSESEVQEILVKILPVLDFVHAQRIVHRDIKPDNIILRSDDRMPVLIDFGAMKEAMTTIVTINGYSTSMAIGTQGYMAPEQAAGRPIYSSDLYSLGLTAVYLLTGKSPQSLETDSRTGEVLWREALPNLHSHLATVLDRTIRFHPGDRISSAQEMLAALQKASLNLKVNSHAATVAVGGRYNNRNSNNNSQSKFTQIKTVPVKRIAQPKKEPNLGKSLFLLGALFLVALGSFVFGFKTFLNQNLNPEVPSRTETETFPRENNQIPTSETETPREIETEPETGSETTLDSNPQPESQSPEVLGEMELESQAQEQQKREQELQREQQKREQELQREQQKREQELQREQQKREQELQREQESIRKIQVPIVRTGTSESELISKLGQPTSKNKGYWDDSVAWLYKDVVSNQVDLGYIFDQDTQKLRQTEVSFASSVDLSVMQKTLAGLLGGSASPSVKEALRQVHAGETDLRSFNLGNLQGMIQRQAQERIYIAVWDADFH
jgi:serine/threonine-protein kinase